MRSIYPSHSLSFLALAGKSWLISDLGFAWSYNNHHKAWLNISVWTQTIFSFLATPCGMWNFPDQGSDPCPQHRVLMTGPLGKSSEYLLKRKYPKPKLTKSTSKIEQNEALKQKQNKILPPLTYFIVPQTECPWVSRRLWIWKIKTMLIPSAWIFVSLYVKM